MDLTDPATLRAAGLLLVAVLVFVAMLVEATPGLGILVPGQTVVVLGAMVATQQGWSILWILIAAFLGGIVGDTVSYVLGRRYGPPLLERLPRWIRPGPERIEQGSRLMGQHGFKLIFVGRFQPITRSFGPFFAGVGRMGVPRFMAANIAGSAAISTLLVGTGYLAGLGVRHAFRFLGLGLLWAFLGAVAIFAVYWLATKRLALLRKHTLTAMIVASLGIPWSIELGHEIGRRHFFVRWEEQIWGVVAPLMSDPLHDTMQGIAWAGNLYVVAALGLALFLALAAMRRWRDAYMALVIGPVVTGLVMLGKALVPRAAPLHAAPFAPFSSYPDPGSALLGPLVVFVAWMLLRGRRVGVLAQSVLWALGITVLTVNTAAFLSGQAWPTDIIGGWLLGGSMFSLAYVVRTAVDTVTGPSPPRHTATALAWWDAWRRRPGVARFGSVLHRHLYDGTTALWLLIAFGVGGAISSYWVHPLGIDANRYAVMGESFRTHGTFLMPWGDVYSPGTGPQYSHHYPPLYPMVLSVFFRIFGFSAGTVHIAAITLSLASMVVTYACSRDLYGHRKALIATAIVAITPALVQNTAKGYSESLVLMLFVATMWAILKSLETPGYIVPGGLLAGISYLTKSSMGYFFIIAGLGGLAWRLHYKGLAVFRDKYYLTAGSLFGGFVVAWAWRNWHLFHTWETSGHLTAAYRFALHDPITWALRSILTFGFMLVMGYFLYLGLAPWLPRFIRFPKLESEHDSGLWLSIGLPLILTAVIDAALWMYEVRFFFNNLRYVSFVIVPLVWLVMRNVPWDRTSKVAATISVAILLGISIGYVAVPGHPAPVDASHALGDLVADGDVVVFAGIHDVYRYYFDATEGGRQIEVRVTSNSTLPAAADWVVSDGDLSFAEQGFVPVGEYGPLDSPLREPITIWRPA